MNKVVNSIITTMIYKLINKFFATYIQHNFGWMLALYFITNCLG